MKFLRKMGPLIVAVALFISGTFIMRDLVLPMVAVHRREDVQPVQRRFFTLNGEVHRTNRLLQRVMLADAVRNSVPDHPGFFVNMPNADSSGATYLTRLATRELPKNIDAAIGVVAYPANRGGHPDVSGFSSRRWVFSGEKNNRPYCVVAVPYWGDPKQKHFEYSTETGGGMRRFTGACRFVAKYGVPGDAVRRWLDASASAYSYDDWTDVPNFGLWSIAQRAGLFGRHRMNSSFMPLAVQACIAGREPYCEQLLLRSSPRQTMFDVEEFTWVPIDAVMNSLERQFGPDRFARFWTSHADVKTAFSSAFQTTPGAWLSHWVSERAGRYDAGPAIGANSVLLTLLTVGVFVGLIVVIAQRRSI